MTGSYYNEHDPFAAQWLRNLISAGHIAPGFVDERSIEDVLPDDVREFTQCHWFGGIGIWSHALRSAGWPDDRPVWTGSCPCQPFSAAGKRGGSSDDRHLWPAFHHLIGQCRPATILGEQVASPDGRRWFEGLQADLAQHGYAVGAADTCAAGFSSATGEEGFHIRQRLYWAAHRLDLAAGAGLERRASPPDGGPCAPTGPAGLAGGVGHPEGHGRVGRPNDGDSGGRQCAFGSAGEDMSAEWVECSDGRWRPIEAGTFPLAHEDSNRVGRLRAYGNALDAAQATGFIKAAMSCLP